MNFFSFSLSGKVSIYPLIWNNSLEKDMETIKKNQSEMKNTVTEMKNYL